MSNAEGLSTRFDIFMRLADGHPVWIKAAESLEEAKKQLMELSARTPGDYFIFNSINGEVIEPVW